VLRGKKELAVRKSSLLIIAVLAALALVAGSSASPSSNGIGPSSFIVGATEDNALGEDDGGAAQYDQMTSYGLGAIRISVDYELSDPTTIQQQEQLERAIGPAVERGVRVLLSVAAGHSTDVTADPNGVQKFAAYTALLARTFPDVKDFIIGNEPNLGRFWAPTYNANLSIAAGATYEAALAASYDALKAVSPDIDVIGLALSPRGDDRPGSAKNAISPVRFINAVGKAYRASGRTIPIMDNVSMHPYPNVNTDPPDKGYAWPNIGIANLDRAQQAFWDAFNGTAQPTFQEPGSRSSQGVGSFVQWILDEAGWQTDTRNLPGYTGTETVPPVDEATQARYHAAIVSRFACDPHVAALLFFHWIDETDRDRLQSGLVRADNTVKPGANAVKEAVADGCKGAQITWRHSTPVDGASATWKPKKGYLFFVKAFEDATFTATATPTKKALKLAKKLKKKLKPVTVKGKIKAYVSSGVKLKGIPYKKASSYTFSVKVTADMNRARVTTLKTKKLKKPDIEA
jgi:hypothetical protein